jgi:hypothetical protein
VHGQPKPPRSAVARVHIACTRERKAAGNDANQRALGIPIPQGFLAFLQELSNPLFIPDKDEVPGSNPGRPTPENSVPAGVFTISTLSDAVSRGDRGQTCQASAKRIATAKSIADTSELSGIRPVRMGLTIGTQRHPRRAGRPVVHNRRAERLGTQRTREVLR